MKVNLNEVKAHLEECKTKERQIKDITIQLFQEEHKKLNKLFPVGKRVQVSLNLKPRYKDPVVIVSMLRGVQYRAGTIWFTFTKPYARVYATPGKFFLGQILEIKTVRR